jgi:hypothetical protein
MEYYFSKIIALSFDEAIVRVTEVLNTEVAAINPIASMMAVENQALEPLKKPLGSFRGS